MEERTFYVVGSPHFPSNRDYDTMRCTGGPSFLHLKKALLRSIASQHPSLDIFLEQFCEEDDVSQMLVKEFDEYKLTRKEDNLEILTTYKHALFNEDFYNDAEDAELMLTAAALPNVGGITFKFNETQKSFNSSILERDEEIARNVAVNGGPFSLIIIGSAHPLLSLSKLPGVHYRVNADRSNRLMRYGLRGNLPLVIKDRVQEELQRAKVDADSDPLVGSLNVATQLEYA